MPLQHGDSAELVVGQKVLAIGNPFGLDHTLTTGVISAVGREIPSLAGTLIEDVIQTDASINPGNSGGPLLDSSGRLIGVNTSIVGPAGQSAGIGFAVPSSTVNRIVPQLIRFGKVKRAGLGIRILPDYVAERWGVDGVIVRDLSPGNAAQRAGLQAIRVDRWGSVTSFDLIVGIDDDAVGSYNDLYRALDGRKAGESIKVHFDRSGRRHTTDLVLQEIN
jgi:S1-C subfamily serine protease